VVAVSLVMDLNFTLCLHELNFSTTGATNVLMQPLILLDILFIHNRQGDLLNSCRNNAHLS
jgi:hypothetical protein